ncbi:pol [Symbiodinium sp. CCMP2592]|nr:pol [Symbiodinium sp. CCMP2592]
MHNAAATAAVSAEPGSMVIDIGPALMKAKETVNEGGEMKGRPKKGGPEPFMDFAQASEIPVPADESSSPLKREAQERVDGRSPKKSAPSKEVVQVDMSQLAALLEQTGQKIMKAQHEHLEARMGALEELTGKRLASSEGRIGRLEDKFESVESRLDELTKQIQQKGTTTSGKEPDRRFTLVYGGWPRDSRRDDILQQLQKSLDKLGVWESIDYAPFTTGPRRSTALSVFAPRGCESEYEVKRRMHTVIRSLADNEIKLSGGKQLFATFAKSKEERIISGHAAWVKRAVVEVCGLDTARGLDIEYTTGSVWLGNSFVASAKTPHPPGIASQELLWDDDKSESHWIHVGSAYRDAVDTKEAFRRARTTKRAEDWTLARKFRKRDRRKWEMDRMQRATSGDWQAFRELKPERHYGWDTHFAEAQQEQDPHTAIHEHLETIYTTGVVVPPLPPWEGPVADFTTEELRFVLTQGKPGKAVGTDGTSQDFLSGLAQVPGGLEALLQFFNQVYRTADIPEDWGVALMLVIPKEALPTEPKNLRPLSLGSGVAKCFSRLLMLRTSSALRPRGWSQCSGPGRQTNEYLFGIGRIMQLEAEWHSGFAMAKIDLHKAYDLVHRPAMLQRLQQALGDGPTYRCWHTLLSETSAILQTEWGQTRLQLDRGIKQGSIESPAIFSWLAEEILEDTRRRYRWDAREPVFEGLRVQELLFMDDGCLWDKTAKGLSQKLEEWATELALAGLQLNPAKCKVYFSPYLRGPRGVRVRELEVPEVKSFEVMGVPFRVGATSSELIAPFLQRAKDKFWSLKHLLRAHTPLKGRICLLDRVVGGLVLWCLASLAPDNSSMALLNTLQLQLVIWSMRLAKRPDESWLSFRKRSYRGARQVVWTHLQRRWSTCWLDRWWCFAGHRARGLDRDVPGAASIVDAYRDREWWTAEQSKPVDHRVQHPRHFPKLSNMEKDMDTAATGSLAKTCLLRAHPCFFAMTGVSTLSIFWTVWVLSWWMVTAVPPLGSSQPPMTKEAKRTLRTMPKETQAQPASPSIMPFPQGKGRAARELPQETDDEASWMQKEAMNHQAGEQEPWATLLLRIHGDLDAMPKHVRGVAAGQLLRWLDHHATDVESGYLLGHMGGYTQQLTAVLVAMRDDEREGSALNRGTRWFDWTLEIWKAVCVHIPCQDGSAEDLGRELSMELPTVMLFSRALPTDTPESVQPIDSDVEEGPPRTKRKVLQVELSSGSADRPRTTTRLELPLNETGTAELHMTATVAEVSLTPQTSPTPPSALLALPDQAPHGLHLWGLSMSDYNALWASWRTGCLSVAEISRVHGPVVAATLMREWGALPVEAYLPDAMAARDPLEDEPITKDAEGDENGLSQWWWTLVPAVPGMPGRPTVPQTDSFFPLGRRVVQYLVGQGAESGLLATVLQMMAEDRHSHDYDIMLQDYLLALDLPVEADCARENEVEPHHRDVLQWIEEELWEEFIDLMEATAGWESDGVMSLRTNRVISQADMGVWRDWATSVTSPLSPPSRTRSRSPRRTEGRDHDASSLMDTTGSSRPRPRRAASTPRPSDASPGSSGDGDRGARPAATPRPSATGSTGARDRERSARHSRTSEADDDSRPRIPRRSTTRCTEEVRHLNPLARRSHRHLVSRDRPMDAQDATLWWLRVLGLRSPTDPTVHRVLHPDGHQDRIAEINDIPASDLLMIVVGLLRVTAMLWVECCQLVFHHPRLAADVEVTVEEEDETMWMQLPSAAGRDDNPDEASNGDDRASHWNGTTTDEENHALGLHRRRTPCSGQSIDTEGRDRHAGLEPGNNADPEMQQLLDDELEADADRRLQQERHEGWEAWKACDEAKQAAQDAEAFSAYQAARYRDWEDWELQTARSDLPRRLRIALQVTHGSQTTQAACSLPLARGRDVHFSVQMQEIEMAPPPMDSGEHAAPQGSSLSLPASTSAVPHDNRPLDDLYAAWIQGRVSDAQLLEQVGEELYVLFLGQRADMEDDDMGIGEQDDKYKGMKRSFDRMNADTTSKGDV